MNLEETNHEPKRRHLFWKALAALIILVVLGNWSRLIYFNHKTTWGLSSDTLASIEFRPNGDWDLVELKSREEIDGFVEWLDSTTLESNVRSAPPGFNVEVVMRYKDGQTETFLTSAIAEPRTPEYRRDALNRTHDRSYEEWRDTLDAMESHEPFIDSPRGAIRVRIRGMTRNGPLDPLHQLIGLEPPPDIPAAP